ncbi:PREDICTED: high affinity immunoglobulin epsilon receptor subunit beta [Elephantulus edwardii]|uniref:high affinity immunoglobulin epsilon receptor subunit beta n=1 Tax=Elephantulus edwardii TaxID=28737 RepID=UPI0003F06BB1|nr:PREDICTED: high affinity immunoglobulin epsilon receptor subunit beta [Elephantulus edwardii]
MDMENTSRADLALPNPHGHSSTSGIELAEIATHDHSVLEKPAPPIPQRTCLTLLRKELEFLGVTQVLISLICLSFGIIVYAMLDLSESQEETFSSFKTGYPFWGAISFAISGVLSVMCERRNEAYLVPGRLGANSISSIASGAGIIILVINLKQSSSQLYKCLDVDDEACASASLSTEIVAMLLFLTVLGFCSAVSLTVYGIGELLRKEKVPEDRLYEELNVYAPIYSELEDRPETSPSTDT